MDEVPYPPKPTEPPKTKAEKPLEIPPILDKSKRAEVAAEIVKSLGNVLISAIGIYSVLMMKGQFDLSMFLTLWVFTCKDTVVQLVSYLTGARTEQLKIKHERLKEEWEHEKEKLRLAITEANVQMAHMEAEVKAARAEANAEKHMKEEMIQVLKELREPQK